MVPFQFAGPAVAMRLAKKASMACATDPTVLARQQACEPVREGAGLALGEVDQNVGDLGRLLGQVDPANGVSLVFSLGKPFSLRIRGTIRQRVNRRALGVTLAARQGVGMHRDEQRRRLIASDPDPVGERYE